MSTLVAWREYVRSERLGEVGICLVQAGLTQRLGCVLLPYLLPTLLQILKVTDGME
jgi:hypothetical protein